MSQPITGTPKEPDSNEPGNARRASEGKYSLEATAFSNKAIEKVPCLP